MKKLLIGASLWLGLIAPSIGQTVIQNQISGNEVWSAAQNPGGPSNWLNIKTVQGGKPITTTSVTGATNIPANLSDGGNLVITNAAGTAAITFPANVVPNGATVGICNGTAAAFVGTLTATANTNQTVVNGTITNLAAGVCARYQFNVANTTWYRVQ